VQQARRQALENLLDRCLAAFVEAGTLDLSLDQLANRVGTSKRMLVHYFRGRENIEEKALTRLEEKLRAQFGADSFPRGATPRAMVTALWNRTTAPESRSLLLLVMDLCRRAWKGSKRAKAFYEEQRRLWVELLQKSLADRTAVEEFLQLFQGALLAYLITGEREQGKHGLLKMLAGRPPRTVNNKGKRRQGPFLSRRGSVARKSRPNTSKSSA